MTPNAIKQDVLAGQTVAGAMVFEFFSPGMSAILANAGCRFVLYDMEHTGLGFETLKWLFSSCRGLPIEPMVRVPRGEYTWLARALDLGARGVMIPMVETADQARSIVQACRYPPVGRRGAAFGFAQCDYLGGDVGCDDGSTDRSVEQVQRHFGHDPRVRLIQQKNGGIGAASNTAVRAARGAYVGQLDADDVLKRDAVEQALKVLGPNPRLSLVYATTEYIDDDSRVFSEGWNWPVFTREYLLTRMICHHFRFFRKRDWARTSGFNESIRNAVDYDMMLKLAAAVSSSGRLIRVDESWPFTVTPSEARPGITGKVLLGADRFPAASNATT